MKKSLLSMQHPSMMVRLWSAGSLWLNKLGFHFALQLCSSIPGSTPTVTVNQHPPVHHPLDARNYSVVDEPQQS
jgi:hypothetical protein